MLALQRLDKFGLLQGLAPKTKPVVSALTKGKTGAAGKWLKELANKVVEKDRERVFSLMWNLLASCRLPVLLPEARLRAEVNKIVATSVPAMVAVERFDREIAASSAGPSSPYKPKTWMSGAMAAVDPDSTACHILRWAQAAIAAAARTSTLTVREFSASFSDGRALCWVLHYYHPWLLPHTLIRSTLKEAQDANCAPCSPAAINQLLEGERRNMRGASRVASALGCVPIMSECWFWLCFLAPSVSSPHLLPSPTGHSCIGCLVVVFCCCCYSSHLRQPQPS